METVLEDKEKNCREKLLISTFLTWINILGIKIVMLSYILFS
jgi:hypothetical protein